MKKSKQLISTYSIPLSELLALIREKEELCPLNHIFVTMYYDNKQQVLEVTVKETV